MPDLRVHPTNRLVVAALVSALVLFPIRQAVGTPSNLTVATGCAPSDNLCYCAALLAVYAAWGNKPSSWAAGIAAGSSYCMWDPYTGPFLTLGVSSAGTIACGINGRVTILCAARPLSLLLH